MREQLTGSSVWPADTDPSQISVGMGDDIGQSQINEKATQQLEKQQKKQQGMNEPEPETALSGPDPGSTSYQQRFTCRDLVKVDDTHLGLVPVLQYKPPGNDAKVLEVALDNSEFSYTSLGKPLQEILTENRQEVTEEWPLDDPDPLDPDQDPEHLSDMQKALSGKLEADLKKTSDELGASKTDLRIDSYVITHVEGMFDIFNKLIRVAVTSLDVEKAGSSLQHLKTYIPLLEFLTSSNPSARCISPEHDGKVPEVAKQIIEEGIELITTFPSMFVKSEGVCNFIKRAYPFVKAEHAEPASTSYLEVLMDRIIKNKKNLSNLRLNFDNLAARYGSVVHLDRQEGSITSKIDKFNIYSNTEIINTGSQINKMFNDLLTLHDQEYGELKIWARTYTCDWHFGEDDNRFENVWGWLEEGRGFSGDEPGTILSVPDEWTQTYGQVYDGYIGNGYYGVQVILAVSDMLGIINKDKRRDLEALVIPESKYEKDRLAEKIPKRRFKGYIAHKLVEKMMNESTEGPVLTKFLSSIEETFAKDSCEKEVKELKKMMKDLIHVARERRYMKNGDNKFIPEFGEVYDKIDGVEWPTDDDDGGLWEGIDNGDQEEQEQEEQEQEKKSSAAANAWDQVWPNKEFHRSQRLKKEEAAKQARVEAEQARVEARWRAKQKAARLQEEEAEQKRLEEAAAADLQAEKEAKEAVQLAQKQAAEEETVAATAAGQEEKAEYYAELAAEQKPTAPAPPPLSAPPTVPPAAQRPLDVLAYGFTVAPDEGKHIPRPPRARLEPLKLSSLHKEVDANTEESEAAAAVAAGKTEKERLEAEQAKKAKQARVAAEKAKKTAWFNDALEKMRKLKAIEAENRRNLNARLYEKRSADWRHKKLEGNAAKKIQAVHRGKKGRKKAKQARVAAEQAKEGNAATKIQAVHRGKTGRAAALKASQLKASQRDSAKDWVYDQPEQAIKLLNGPLGKEIKQLLDENDDKAAAKLLKTLAEERQAAAPNTKISHKMLDKIKNKKKGGKKTHKQRKKTRRKAHKKRKTHPKTYRKKSRRTSRR